MTHPSTDALFDHLAATDVRVADHVQACAACRAELTAMRELVDGARHVEGVGDDDALIALALDELPAAPANSTRRWLPIVAVVVAMAAVVAFLARTPAVPAVTIAVVDARTGAFLAAVPEGAFESFAVPVRLVFGDGLAVDFEPNAAFVLTDATPPDAAFRLDRGTATWSVVAAPGRQLTVATPEGPVAVQGGVGRLVVGTTVEVTVTEGLATRGDQIVAPAPAPKKRRVPKPVEPGPDAVIAVPIVEPVVPTTPEAIVPVDEPPAPVLTPHEMYFAAEAAMARGDFPAAERLLQGVIDGAPDDPAGHLAMFELARLTERADPARALALYRRYAALGVREPLYREAIEHACRLEPSDCP